jgi:hypothetical protein
MNVKNIITREALGHFTEEPAESVVGLNVKIWVVKPFIA